MGVENEGIIVCRDTAIAEIDSSELVPSPMNADLLTQRINFKEMSITFIQVFFPTVPDQNDFTFQLMVSNIKDPASFVPYDLARIVPVGCPGIGWNLRHFGFLYARIDYKKGTVSSGTMRILARAKKG